MIGKVKIRIEEDEWAAAPIAVRERILELMLAYGYDIKMLQALERDVKSDETEDIYRQFYGEEE